MMFHPAYLMINAILLGHLPEKIYLASLGLGSLTTSIVLLSITVSFNGALDTLIPQAHGQNDTRMCGIYLNRQLLLISCIFIPLTFPLFFIERIYLAMG